MMLNRSVYSSAATAGTSMTTLYLNNTHSTRLEWIA
ncbi:hypothetical protein FB550_10418 [Neobacillus bataviensis]|uniref:Uncharacterized protein n=1 Tax=Neobacillus bataviensis TaxID=220685 RepID=A0A561DGK8_9BACI|nr:hypothetical protein FB550_10418 [Neobacillus bataviensis]